MVRRFVYVVTEGDEVRYADMACVSMRFVKRLHGEAGAVVLCDPETDTLLRQADHPLRRLADEWWVRPAPMETPVERSRYLKASMRHLVDGAFVFLDVDTMPVARLDELFAGEAPVAAVKDSGDRFETNWVRDGFAQMQWQRPENEQPYFNSGVMYLDDSDACHRLAGLWLAKWLHWVHHNGTWRKHRDQPALNSAIVDLGIGFRVLPAVYNGQFAWSHRLALGAKVLHFYQSLPGIWEQTVFHELVERVRREGRIADETVDGLIRHPYPWRRSGAIRAHWHARQYGKAAVAAAGRLVGRRWLMAANGGERACGS